MSRRFGEAKANRRRTDCIVSIERSKLVFAARIAYFGAILEGWFCLWILDLAGASRTYPYSPTKRESFGASSSMLQFRELPTKTRKEVSSGGRQLDLFLVQCRLFFWNPNIRTCMAAWASRTRTAPGIRSSGEQFVVSVPPGPERGGDRKEGGSHKDQPRRTELPKGAAQR